MKKMSVRITCDRCGKEISNWFDKFIRLHKSKRKFIMLKRDYEEMDLCEDCYESFKNWYYRKDTGE